jgi:hypothetical protein
MNKRNLKENEKKIKLWIMDGEFRSGKGSQRTTGVHHAWRGCVHIFSISYHLLSFTYM